MKIGEHILRVLTPFSLACAVAAAGCTDSTATPPTALCGKTIDTAAAGADTVVATSPGVININKVGRAGSLLVELSLDCSHGASVQLIPSTRIVMPFTVPTTDGRLAAVVIGPRAKLTEVVVTHPNGKTTDVKIDLAQVPACHVPIC